MLKVFSGKTIKERIIQHKFIVMEPVFQPSKLNVVWIKCFQAAENRRAKISYGG